MNWIIFGSSFFFISVLSIVNCCYDLSVEFVPSSSFHCLFPRFRSSLSYYFLLTLPSRLRSPVSTSVLVGYMFPCDPHAAFLFLLQGPRGLIILLWLIDWLIDRLIDYLCFIKHDLWDIILLLTFFIDWILECSSLPWVVAFTKSSHSCTWHLFFSLHVQI